MSAEARRRVEAVDIEAEPVELLRPAVPGPEEGLVEPVEVAHQQVLRARKVSGWPKRCKLAHTCVPVGEQL